MRWLTHACPVCRGDLFEQLDDPQLCCLMCGRTFMANAAFGPVRTSEGQAKPQALVLSEATPDPEIYVVPRRGRLWRDRVQAESDPVEGAA